MKRKLWIILALAALALALTCASALADTTGKLNSLITWTLTDGGVLTISGRGATPDYDWTSDETRSPFSWVDNINSVVIEEGVTRVGAQLFHTCRNLSSVTLPSGLRYISERAFYHTAITSIDIPDKVTTISERAFCYCESLSGVTINGLETTVGELAFGHCAENLTIRGGAGSPAETYASENNIPFVSVLGAWDDISWTLDEDGLLTISTAWNVHNSLNMPDFTNANPSPFWNRTDIRTVAVTGNYIGHIGNYAFYGCSELTTLNMHNYVNSIGENAFYNCYSLSEIPSWPYYLRTIGGYAFYNTRITSVELRYTGTSSCSIGNGAFRLCWNITDLHVANAETSFGIKILENPTSSFHPVIHGYVDSTAQTYASNNGFTFDSYDLTGVCGDNVTWVLDKREKTLFFHGSGPMWESIGADQAWRPYSDAFSSVHIDSGITSVAANAFSGCANLWIVSYYSDDVGKVAVSEIGASAFENTGLETIYIPSSVTIIGDGAYRGCQNVTDIRLSEGLETIGVETFKGCDKPTEIALPASVASVGARAFENCASVTSITINSSSTVLGAGAFAGCADGLTIHGWAGSTAAAYAAANGVNFDPWPLSGQCGDNVTWQFDAYAGVATFTGSGPMWDYDDDTHSPFWNNPSVRNAVIGSGITSVGGAIFSSCANLTSVTIPGSVQSIGDCAFNYCESLASVTIPSSVTSIGSLAFYGCSSLTSLTIPDSVTSIGDSAFSKCTGLTSLTIPNSVTSIGLDAFSYCTALTNVTIPNSMTIIGTDAFYYCTALTNVTIPNSVTSIGRNAFYHCTALTNVNIPNSVTSIGSDAFYYCTALTNVTIPGSVQSLGQYAFYNCTGLTSVAIQDGVTSIGDYAFRNCTSLTNVSIPGSVQSIGVEAFESCASLASLTLRDGLKTIGISAFMNCASLTSVTIPGSVSEIGGYAFGLCTGLTSLTIREGVETIGHFAFYGCSDLTSLSLPDSITTIKYDAFYGCSSLTRVKLPNRLTKIETGLFSDCSSLAYVFIPESVTKIESGVFYNCTSLTGISLPSGLNDMPTFAGCTALTSVAVHNRNCYYWSDTLSDRPSTLVLYGYSGSTTETFANKNGITFVPFAEMAEADFTLPAAMTRIEAQAFDGAKMTAVYIPDGVTYLGSKAFANCVNLTRIRIPAGITVIPPDVFYNVPKANITIFGAAGSAAQTYANNAGIRFEAE